MGYGGDGSGLGGVGVGLLNGTGGLDLGTGGGEALVERGNLIVQDAERTFETDGAPASSGGQGVIGRGEQATVGMAPPSAYRCLRRLRRWSRVAA